MRIICDTNAWYKIGAKGLPSLPTGSRLIGTYCSLEELTSTNNLVGGPSRKEAAENAIRSFIRVCKGQRQEYFFHPWDFIKWKDNDIVPYNPLEHFKSLFLFLSAIANGDSVSNEFKDYVNATNARYSLWVDFYTENGKEIHARLNDKNRRRNHLKEDSTFLNRDHTSFFVGVATVPGCKEAIAQANGMIPNLCMGISNTFNWDELELFQGVLGVWHNEIETGAVTSIEVNDFHDLHNMVYVSPGDKYWTEDGLWKRRIEKAGLTEYLFSPEVTDK
ncbi:MAG: hypothetical protein AAF998_06905 [Bacteroidota bacterium]